MITRMPVTFDEMSDAIQALHVAVPRFGMTPQALPQIVRVYREALENFDGEAVRGAAAMLVKTVEKFPSPSLWRETCLTWLKHNRIVLEREPEVDRDGNDIVCRICRSVPHWAVLRMVPSPHAAPMAAAKLPLDPAHPEYSCEVGETLRRIAVCDPSRHHTPHGITPLPDNFLRWVQEA